MFHEHLERTNLPLYFHQFIERAERAGLQYLSEAVVSEMLTSHFPAPVAATLERISPGSAAPRAVHGLRAEPAVPPDAVVPHDGSSPRRAMNPAVLHGLLVSSPATTEARSQT